MTRDNSNIDHDDVRIALAKLMVVFPTGGGDTDQRFKLEAYHEVLRTLPPRFVVAACQEAAKMRIGDGRFLPGVGILFKYAEGLAEREARHSRPIALPPPVREVPPDAQLRIANGLAELAKDLANSADPFGQHRKVSSKPLSHVTEREAESNLERLSGEAMPKISDALRGKLGIKAPYRGIAGEDELSEVLR